MDPFRYVNDVRQCMLKRRNDDVQAVVVSGTCIYISQNKIEVELDPFCLK